MEVHEAKYEKAVELFDECLDWNRQLGDPHGMIACLAGYAAIHQAKGNLEKAAVLYGSVESLLRQSGNTLLFTDTVEYEQSVALLKQNFDPQAFSIAWGKGAGMLLEQALDLARQGLM